MGRKARQFNLVMTVIGADYMAQRDRLIEALEAAGPGSLVHPFYGELQVAVLGDYSIEESTEQGGLARITQNFVEAGERPRPDNQPLAGAAVNTAADRVQQEAVAEFEQAFSVAGYAGFVAEAAIATLQDATRAIGNAGGLLGGASQFGTLLGRLTSSAQGLILAPGNLAGNLLGLVRSMTATGNPLAAFQAQLALFGLGRQAKAVRSSGYVTPARAQQANNQAALYRLVERAAVAEAARLATGRPVDSSGQPLPGLSYPNREQAVETRDLLVDELDRQQLEASPERYRALAGLSAALVSDLNRRSAALAPLARFTPGTTMPALLIAHRLYGDASRADEIVARNRIAHPGFVPGGQALEVLKDA